MNIDRSVSALLWHKDEVLLHKHKKLGCWIGPGGHVESGELDIDALSREILEETGLSVTWEVEPVDFNRKRLVAPNDVVLIKIDDTGKYLLDSTFIKEVSEDVRNTPLVSEVPPEDIGWFNIDWALSNLKMFPDTFTQVCNVMAISIKKGNNFGT